MKLNIHKSTGLQGSGALRLLLSGPCFVLVHLDRSSTAADLAEVLKRDGVAVLERDAETVRLAYDELQGRMKGKSVRYGDSTQLLKRPLDPTKVGKRDVAPVGQERALRQLAEDEVIIAAAELARQEHGEGSHHSIPWEVRRFRTTPRRPGAALNPPSRDAGRWGSRASLS